MFLWRLRDVTELIMLKLQRLYLKTVMCINSNIHATAFIGIKYFPGVCAMCFGTACAPRVSGRFVTAARFTAQRRCYRPECKKHKINSNNNNNQSVKILSKKTMHSCTERVAYYVNFNL